MTATDHDRVGVLGSGTMAPGIAVAFAAAGYDVVLWGRTTSAAAAALARAADMARFLETHQLAGPAAQTLEQIRTIDRLDQLGDARVVVEAVAEDLHTKRAVLAAAEPGCSADTLLATNTSGLRVSDIAQPLARPERLVAMHFWNPAHLMPIVEIASGTATRPEAIAEAVRIATMLGKVPVTLRRETLGFLGTRMQQAVVREAISLVQRDAASIEDIDLAVRMSFGVRFPVIGPLESADLTGLDVIEAIHAYLLADLDNATDPQPALTQRVANGDLGVKSGRGFYDWSERDAAALAARRDQEIAQRLRLIAAETARSDAAGRVGGQRG